jgi:hypothetical protein
VSHKPVSPALHIARKHQSAPSEHFADKAIKQAAEEIDGGRWIPEIDDDAMDGLGLSLGLGQGGTATGNPDMTFAGFQKEAIATRDLNQLAKHPRVIEALERMKREAEEAKSPQERIEKLWAIHETNELAAEKDKWDGQERWEGKENEEMRHGRIMRPQDFCEELFKVIGRDRVLLSTHIVFETERSKTGVSGMYVKNPLWQGDPMIAPQYVNAQVANLRKAAEGKQTEARKLRAAKQNALADKASKEAFEILQAATELRVEQVAEEQDRPPEFLRVATVQWPLSTEWMVMSFTEYGVPKRAKYLGWRTALLTMVRTRAITEEEAHRAFPVGSGPAGDWYLEQLWMRRNEESVVQ